MGVSNRSMYRPTVTYYKSVQELFPEGIYWNSGVQTSATTAASVFTEYSTSGLVAWQGIAAGDAIVGIGFPFKELDYNEVIEVAVVMTSAATGADTPVFKLGFDAITFGSALPTPMTTLTTMTAYLMDGTAGHAMPLVWTALSAGYLKRDTLYAWGLELDSLGSASTTELYTFGLLYRGKQNVTGQQSK